MAIFGTFVDAALSYALGIGTDYGIRYYRRVRPMSRLLAPSMESDQEVRIVVSTLYKDPQGQPYLFKKDGSAVRHDVGFPLNDYLDSVAVGISYGMLLSAGKDAGQIRVLTDEEIRDEDLATNLICIGAGANSLTRRMLDSLSPFFTFEKKTVGPQTLYGTAILRGSDARKWSVGGGLDYGMVQKLMNGQHMALFIAGLGPRATAGAAIHLLREYRTLHKRFGTAEFGLLLEIDTTRGIQAVREIASASR